MVLANVHICCLTFNVLINVAAAKVSVKRAVFLFLTLYLVKLNYSNVTVVMSLLLTVTFC